MNGDLSISRYVGVNLVCVHVAYILTIAWTILSRTNKSR